MSFLESRLTGSALTLLVVTFWFCLTVALTGCGTTSADRLAAIEATQQQYLAVSETLDESIPQLEAMIVTAEIELESAEGEAADKLRGFIADTTLQLDELKAKKIEVDAAVETWTAKVAEIRADPNVTWADELEAIGSGVQASAPLWGTKAWLAGSVGGLLTLIAKLFQQKRKTEKVTASLGEVVRGVSKAIETEGLTRDQVKKTLKSHQSAETRMLVDQLRPAA